VLVAKPLCVTLVAIFNFLCAMESEDDRISCPVYPACQEDT
jgi:hypothetical protein